MFGSLFRKPEGTGAALTPYMFLPNRLIHALKVLLTEPSYFTARIRTLIYQARHPDYPWLTSDANSFLDEYLKPGMTAFEWGSGRRTIWFVKKGVRMVSVEDNYDWYQKIGVELAEHKAKYFYVEPSKNHDRYSGKINDFPDDYFDLVVVDGSHRNACIRNAVPKVKLGGVVVVDNADQDIDTSPLGHFSRTPTSNGVWRTDLFLRDNG